MVDAEMRLESLLTLFRQQERALAEEHTRQRAALYSFWEREGAPSTKIDIKNEDFLRGVSDNTVASEAEDVMMEKDEDGQVAVHGSGAHATLAVSVVGVAQGSDTSESEEEQLGEHISEDEDLSGGGTSCESDSDHSPDCLHGAANDEKEVHEYSAALEMKCKKGVCEKSEACEKGAGAERCDHFTSEGPRADCIRPCASWQVDGCERPDSASHASDSGGISSPPSVSGTSGSAARGRQRVAPDDGSAFDDEIVDTESNASEPQEEATWAATLSAVERALAQRGLAAAVHLAVESIGGEFQETAPQVDDDQQDWVAMARVVHVATRMELFQGTGKHSTSVRAARRTAYCPVLSYAVCQIAVNIVKALRPTQEWDGITFSALHPHLHGRLRDLLQAAERGRKAHGVERGGCEPH